MNGAGAVHNRMQDLALQQAIAQVPDAYRKAIADQATQNQIVFKRDPYYSKGRLQMTVSGSTTYTITKGFQAVLFGYGQNDAMVGAGFPAGIGYDSATLADTNLFKGGETNAAELELINGIGFQLCPDVDPLLARRLLHQSYISAGVNGNTNDFKWGSPLFWPGGAGLYGSAPSQVQIPDLTSNSTQQGVMTNGIPGSEDWSKDIDPILWGPKGQADSTFQVVVNIQRTVVFTIAARAAIPVQAMVTTVGTTAFVAPIAPAAPSATSTVVGEGTYIDFFVRAYGAQFAPRGRNR